MVVLGDISEQPAEHYITPGQPSLVILASPANVVFQPASPAVTEEPLGPSLDLMIHLTHTGTRACSTTILRHHSFRLPTRLRAIIKGTMRVCSGRRKLSQKREGSYPQFPQNLGTKAEEASTSSSQHLDSVISRQKRKYTVPDSCTPLVLVTYHQAVALVARTR
jgi:hypothetical protein